MKHASDKKKTAVVAAPTARKFQPKNSAKSVKIAAKKAIVSAVKSKPKKKKPAVSIAESKKAKAKSSGAGKKVKPVVGKTRAITARAAKTAKPEISVKKSKAARAESQAATIKKTKSAAPKMIAAVKKNAMRQSTAAIKKSKNAEIQLTVSAAKKTKPISAKVKPTISARGKVKSAPAKPETIASAGKIKSAALKTIVPVKKIKSAKLPTLPAAKKVKKSEPPTTAERKNTAKAQTGVSVKGSKIERRNIKPAVFVKTPRAKSVVKADGKIQAPKIFAAVKIRKQKIDVLPTHADANKIQPQSIGETGKIGRRAEVEAAENKIEAVNLPVAPKPKKRKAKAIGAAVFRGRKGRYDFQVFPLDSEFDQAVSGIYVISKRKTDHNKRAHHALVCIGQTESVAGEIKRHAKNCIKKHAANVISILPEGNEKKRLKIEEDLKAAHSIACGVS